MATVGVLEIQMAADLARLSKDMSKARNTVSNTVSNINKILGAIGVGLSLNFFKNLAVETTKLNQRYQELGISLSVVGRNVGIQRQELDKTATSLQRLGISMIESRQTVLKLASANIELSKAEQLADLARNAAIVGQINTSEALGRIVHGIRSAELEVLKTIGITVSFEQSYKDLAAQLGVTTKDLTQLQKQQARLNVVLAEAPALAGLYEAAMGNAGKQFRSTDRLIENLKVRIGELFDLTARSAIAAYTDLLKDMDGTIDDVTESGEFKRWGDDIARTLAFIADATQSVISIFNILGLTIGARAAQAAALANLDFSGVQVIQQALESDVQKEIENMSRATDALEAQIIQRDLLTDAVTGVSNSLKKKEDQDKEEIKTTGKQTKQAENFIKALKKEAEEAGKTADQIKRMEAAQLGVLAAAEPYLRVIEDQRIAEEDLRISRDKQADDLRRIEQITDSVKTKQEVYNETVAELDRLLKEGLGLETYNRALREAQEELHAVTETNRHATDEIEQLWIQAGRNIQNVLADSIFDFFRDGLKGMVSNLTSAAGRIASQFAAINISRSLGLGGLLTGASGAASAASGGVGAFDIASLGVGALNLVKSGFGVTPLVGNAALSLGKFTGLSGLTEFGAGILNPSLASFVTGGQGSLAASAGGAFSSLAGPLAVAGVADFGLRQLFGDKKLGGTAGDILNFVPIVGTLINGLFGRGAPKFRREELVGNVGAGGFEGVFNTQFREKGGLLRGNRVSNFITDTDTGELLNQFGRLSESGNFPKGLLDSVGGPASERALEIGKFLDETFTTLADTLENTAEVLGISKDSLSNFNAELDLTSEKGEQLSQEQISEAIADISDQMVRELIPSIDELSRSSESATDTLQRLSADFQAIEKGFLFAGQSIEDARAKTQGLSFDQRTAVTDRFDGAGGLSAQLDNFFSNVLDESKQLEIVEKQVMNLLEAVGIDFIPTLDQLADAFQHGSPAIQDLVLQHDDLIITYQNLKDSVQDATEAAKDAADKERALANERRSFTAARREAQAGGLAPTIATTISGKIFTEEEIRAQQQSALDGALQAAKSAVEEQISRLTESMRTARSMVQEQLRSVTESIRFFDKFKEDSLQVANKSFFAAKEQLNASIALARAGATVEEIDTPELANAINILKTDRSSFFETRKEFEKDKADTAQKLAELSSIGKDSSEQQIDLLTQQLEVMQATFNVETQSLNGLIEFINFQGGVQNPAETVSRLSDNALNQFANDSINSLNLNERIQRNTSFNGSVQFPFPAGTNESADNADRARLQKLSVFQSNAESGGDISTDILEELRNLKKEISISKSSTEQLYKIMNSVTRGGRAMQTQAAT